MADQRFGTRRLARRRLLLAARGLAAAALAAVGCTGSAPPAPGDQAPAVGGGAAGSGAPAAGSPAAVPADSPAAAVPASAAPSPAASGPGTAGNAPVALARPASGEAPRKGGGLRTGATTDLNLAIGYPFVILPQNGLMHVAVHEQLVRYRDSLQPELVLADRFEYNADRSAVTVGLKPGVTFHNGAPVTPEDVFFGIEVIRDPAKFNIAGSFQLATFTRFIKEMRKLDDRTMLFTLDRPRVNMTDFFAQLQITQAATYDALRTGKDVQGTGPYRFKSWTPGQGYRLEPNPSWHGASKEGGPYLEAVEVRTFADSDALGLAFEAGEVDIYFGAKAPIAARFRDRGLTRVAPKVGLGYLGFNVTNPLLADKRVRQAILYAIDRPRLTNEIGEGFGDITVQPWPKTSPAFDPALDAPYYDPDRARALLKAAGFSQSEPLVYEYAAEAVPTIAPVVKENLDAIGLKIELKPTEGNAFTSRFVQRQFKDFFTSFHAFADLTPLTNFQQTFPYRIPNISYYDSPEYQDIIKQLEDLDPQGAEAKAQYARFNRLVLDDPWLVSLVGNIRIDLISDRLAGFDDYFVTLSQSNNWGRVWRRT